MIREIVTNASFELKIRYRSLSSYVYFSMFFCLGLLITLAAGGALPGAMVSFGTGSRVFINAPLSITFYTALLMAFMLFITAAVFGQAICKDYIHQFDQIVFATPTSTRNFLMGRFLGAFLFMLLICTSIPLGVFIGSVFPMILPTMLGPQFFSAYLYPLVTICMPSIFIFGSLFFFMGSKTKSMTSIYISATILFLMWSASGTLLADVDNKMLASLIDPMGLKALSQTIRYWSVDQQKNQLLGFEGYFLWNRLLWMTMAFVAVAIALLTFSKQPRAKKSAKAQSSDTPKRLELIALTPLHLQKINWLPIFFRQLKFEVSQTIKSIYFIVITLAGVGYMFITGTQVGKMFDTNTYPVTYMILDIIGGTFSLFIMIILTIFTGETIWRDRDIKISQILDATPIPNAISFAAKFVTMILITWLLLTAVMIAGILIQLSYGYTKFELSQYLIDLYMVEWPSYINLIALIFFFQVVSKNKYMAHGLVIAYYLISTFSGALGLNHRLYMFNSSPNAQYSDMNGYGQTFGVFHIYNTYWLFLSVILTLVAFVFWQRGTDNSSFKQIWRELPIRLTPLLKKVTVVALFGFTLFGSYLFYNNNIVNTYLTQQKREKLEIEYEKKYKIYATKPLPTLTAVKANVNIFPHQLKMSSTLTMKFKNTTSQPIDELFVNVDNRNKFTLNFSAAHSVTEDKDQGVLIYKFSPALEANREFYGTFTVDVDKSSIPNGSVISNINHNGTFFNNFTFFPSFGYQESQELNDRKSREKFSLPAKKRKPTIDDKSEWNNNLLGNNGWWIDFEATVSTSKDQIAIAPGYLQKEWLEGDRRYFHYKMDQKIINFYAFLSGRYEVLRDKWNDVNIEIYYHKGHEYNLQRMVKATQMSLDYFSKNFGPYQHKQYRIIEFPRYQTFAQSFPNTIPFSEGIGFIARVDDKNEDDLDYPFYVTSHELAHQWWPHQMIGANVQGSDMLSESLSQYSALMVMEKAYGREKMKKFLKVELDRYLAGRGQEQEYENPIYLAEDQQYIHYQKGSLVFYAIKDYIGEDNLNKALKDSLQQFARTAPPYMTSLDLIDVIKSRTPPEKVQIVEDLLEKIVIFENRPLQAEAQPQKDGSYKVDLTLTSQKIYSDKDGKEENKDFAQEIDIGVLDKDKKYIYLKKHLIKSGENKISLTVPKEPVKAGVDPLNILIDRNSNDNIIDVSVSKEDSATMQKN